MIVMGCYSMGLSCSQCFPVWSIGILFMTWSCPSRTSWSKGTKIQFAQASGIWSGYSEWPPWNGNCYIYATYMLQDAWKSEKNYHSSSWNLLRHFSHLLSQLQTPHCRCVVPSILRLHHLEHQWHTNPDVFELSIHPASRGVAAHTAGLFRSVRGAKGAFPPWGLPKLRIFTSPPVGAPQAKEFSLFPPVGAPQAREFSLFPPVGAPQAREFSLFPRVGAPQAREFSLFPPVGAPQAREFSLFPPVGASQAREFSLFPAVTASQAMEFSLFPPLEALQAAEFQIARQRRLDSSPNPVFFECVSMFLQWFPSKHGTLHFCRHKTGRKHHVR